MRLLKTEDLRAQGHDVCTEGIQGRGGHVIAVVDGVDPGEGIFFRENMVEPRCSKVLANFLGRAAEDFGDAIGVRAALEVFVAGRGSGPKIQQWLNARNGICPRLQVRNECRRSLMQVLAETLVVAENESLVEANWPA